MAGRAGSGLLRDGRQGGEHQLAALATMAWPRFVPTTVPVLFSMSVGQGPGVVAFACYVGAILLEVSRHDQVERALAERADHATHETAESDRS